MSSRRAACSARTWILTFAIFLLCLTSIAHAGPVTITFANRGDAVREDLVRYWIAEFERLNPDIKVDWEIAAGSSWRDQVVVRSAAGVAPDVLEIYGTFARAWAERGMLLDLGPYVKRDLTSEQVRDFFPHLYQAGILNWGALAGLHYGLPSYGNIIVTYYNKNYFDEAGLSYPDQLDRQGNWNWQTLIEVGRKLKRSEGDKVTLWPLSSGDTAIGRGAAWVYAAGGEVFDPQNATRFVLDQPAAIEGLTYLQDLIWTHGVHVPYTVKLDGNESFTSGQVAMRLEGTSRVTRYVDDISGRFDFDIALRPVGPVSRGNVTSFDGFAVNSTTRHPEAAWRMVKYLVTRPGALPHMRILGRGPAIFSVYSEYLKLHPDKNLRFHMEAAQDARVMPNATMVRAEDAEKLIDNALKASVVRNEKSVRTAIEGIAESIRALYK